MNRWKAMIALLLAMLYLPATGHCALEQAGWFPWASDCCERGDSAAGSQPPSCADGCCLVESSDYISPNNARSTMLVVAPPVNVTVMARNVLAKPSLPAAPKPGAPEFSKVWQFAYRTALSPRAPSFVS